MTQKVKYVKIASEALTHFNKDGLPVIQSANEKLVFPDRFQLHGFSNLAIERFKSALSRGTISTREISSLLPRGTGKDREKFSAAMTVVTTAVTHYQIRIVPDKEAGEHNKNFPLIELAKPLKKIEVKSSIRIKEQEVPDNVSILEDINSYEFDLLGRYYAEIRQFQLLSQEEEIELGKRVLEYGDLDARNKLVEHNLRLVRWVARKYSWSKIDFADLLEEGNIGLITAATKYDYRVGRFTTYAMWWVRQAISRAVMNQSVMVRLPVHLQEMHRKVLTVSGAIAEQTGRVPDLDEISKHTGLPKHTIERILSLMKMTVTSLDEPLRKNKNGANEEIGDFGSTLEDQRVLPADLLIEARQSLTRSKATVQRFLRQITPVAFYLFEDDQAGRNLRIFRMRYGLNPQSATRRRLESIGEEFDLTRERVRQVIEKIWTSYQEMAKGEHLTHDSLIQELIRIEELEKLVAVMTGQP